MKHHYALTIEEIKKAHWFVTAESISDAEQKALELDPGSTWIESPRKVTQIELCEGPV